MQVKSNHFMAGSDTTVPVTVGGGTLTGVGAVGENGFPTTGEALGMTFGAIIAVIAVVLCFILACLCFRALKRRKKMWKITQVGF